MEEILASPVTSDFRQIRVRAFSRSTFEAELQHHAVRFMDKESPDNRAGIHQRPPFERLGAQACDEAVIADRREGGMVDGARAKRRMAIDVRRWSARIDMHHGCPRWRGPLEPALDCQTYTVFNRRG